MPFVAYCKDLGYGRYHFVNAGMAPTSGYFPVEVPYLSDRESTTVKIFQPSARVISVTPDAENIMAYCARVSNPMNQESGDLNLLQYCIKHRHWSVFEMANMIVEINTTRAIAPQILRHRSFSFQEFSQRYADVDRLEVGDAVLVSDYRSKDPSNRQNSIDDVPILSKAKFLYVQADLQLRAKNIYKTMIGEGVAHECARNVLPLSTPTRLYMNGSVRSWIHYLDVRSHKSTQKEHSDIARWIKRIFKQKFPTVFEALEWQITTTR